MWNFPGLCPLHWQADSYPLDHQGIPGILPWPPDDDLLSQTVWRIKSVCCSSSWTSLRWGFHRRLCKVDLPFVKFSSAYLERVGETWALFGTCEPAKGMFRWPSWLAFRIEDIPRVSVMDGDATSLAWTFGWLMTLEVFIGEAENRPFYCLKALWIVV